MNNAKAIYLHSLFSFPKIVITSFLCFGLLLFANLAIAKSSSHNGGQWSSVGGKMVASGEGHFSNKWFRSTRYWNGDGNYWKNDEPPSNKAGKIPATHTLEEVTKDVSIRKGQITVRGPGYLGLFIRSKGAGAALKFAKSGKVFHAQGLGEDKWLHDPQNNWKWYPGEVFNADPTNPNLMGGWVPADRTMTLDVWVYNPFSEWGVWGSGYSAPKSVEYEFWYFPLKGGKVIKVAETPSNSVMDNIDTPPLGTIMGGTDEPTLPPNEPITGITGEVPNIPEITPYLVVGKIAGNRKYSAWLKSDYWGDASGDAIIDYGNSVQKRLKVGDKISAGDIIVTGNNTTVHLSSEINLVASIIIGQNSRVKIVSSSLIEKLFGVTYNLIKQAGVKVYNKPGIIIEGGEAVIRFLAEPFMIMLGIWEPKETNDRLPPGSFWGGGVRGTTFRLTYNKSTGDKSITVAEGEVVGGCNQMPETFTSVKAGEILTIDKGCSGQKSNLTTNQIQQITSLLPDIIKTKRLAPIADSFVYAYSYRNWNKANWGKYGSLGAGWHPRGGEKRTYLKFDLSGIDPKNIGKAVLRLFHYHTGGKNSLSLGVHAVTSPWQEGGGSYHSGQTEKTAAPGEISWVKQPTFNFNPAASFKPGSKAGQYIDVDITSLVKAWLSGKPNYGLMIKPVGIMSGRAPESSYGFYSREREDESKRPVLVLSAASQSQGTAWLLTAKSNRDLVGRNEKFSGNGRFDAVFRAQFSAPNRTVTAVDVRNTNGLRSAWDTRPNNRLWLGGVVVGGRTMNQPDGSVNFSLGSGQTTLDFFVEDNGSIKRGKTSYRMTIFFASGDPLIMDVTPLTQTGSGGTGSGTGIGGGTTQGTARLLAPSSNRDMVGRNESLRQSGKTDAVFQARFSAPNRTVTAVEVSNTNGLRSVWDTRPNNRLWLGGVVVNGRTMSRPDGSVNFSLGFGQTTLDFFVEDNGSIRGGKTSYRMTIFFASGDPLIMDITPLIMDTPPPAAIR